MCTLWKARVSFDAVVTDALHTSCSDIGGRQRSHSFGCLTGTHLPCHICFRLAPVHSRAGNLWHSTVTEAELAALAGLLDPKHPDTADVIAQVGASIDLRPAHRILTPDRDTWREAGILAGLLAWLQGYDNHEQRKAHNDALILLTAAKNGCVVLTRNLSEFDLLMQLDARGQAIFYDSENEHGRPTSLGICSLTGHAHGMPFGLLDKSHPSTAQPEHLPRRCAAVCWHDPYRTRLLPAENRGPGPSAVVLRM
jgi:hypothetical protein